MISVRDYRVIILYEYKLGHNAAQAMRNINEAFGANTVNSRMVQRWFQNFRNGNMNLENQERGRPSSVVDDNQLKDLIEKDTQTTVRELAATMNASVGTIWNHLKTIGLVKKLDKWIPHELNENQKKCRYEICSALLLRNQTEPFLDRIVTCDEKWILYDNRKRSAQWLNRDQRPKSFPKQSLHTKKVMVTVWWSTAGVIHYSFLSKGQTITADTYCHIIEEMHRKFALKQPALVNRKGPILLHDNARPHIAKKTLQKLKELCYEALPHPPYSPDLSPTDYHLFRDFGNFLKDKVFRKREDAESSFQDFINSREPEFFENGIRKLLGRWQKCVDCGGCYFD